MSAQEQQQANRGILPSETLNALDYLVDRLNAASGRLPPSAPVAPTAPPTPTTASGSDDSPLPIRALLVGTNEGVGLSRSLGTAHTATQMQNPADPNFSHSGSMSEEVLSGIETVWATLVSAAPPHVMAASAAGAASAAAGEGGGGGGEEDDVPPHAQPPHPLLSPLQMGDHIRTVTATYDNCTLVHVHMAPLVVTFVTLPEANIGAIRSIALPLLKVLLEPVRRALVRSRGAGALAGGETAAGGAVPQGTQAAGAQGQSMEEQARAAQAQQQQQQAQAMMLMQQQQQAAQQQQGMMGQGAVQVQQQGTAYAEGQGAMDPAALQQQLYQQQLYQQQQMMMAQQQFQQRQT